jgi:hypothetical protein
MSRMAILVIGCVVLTTIGCARTSSPQGLAAQNDAESLCVRYAKERDANLKAQIAAKLDAAAMAAIDRGAAEPGVPALVAYCVYGAPTRREKAAAPQGEVERVTFCREPIGPGEHCEALGPTLVIAQDRVMANPAPTPN